MKVEKRNVKTIFLPFTSTMRPPTNNPGVIFPFSQAESYRGSPVGHTSIYSAYLLEMQWMTAKCGLKVSSFRDAYRFNGNVYCIRLYDIDWHWFLPPLCFWCMQNLLVCLTQYQTATTDYSDHHLMCPALFCLFSRFYLAVHTMLYS